MIHVNQTYCGDHFAIYTRIKSLCCTPETCMMLYVNYDKRRLSRFPWTARRSNQSTLKEINLEYSLEGLQYFGHLMQRDPDAGKDWRQKEKGAAEDETLNGITDSTDMNLSKFSGDSEGQEARVFLGLQKVELNLLTEQQHVNCIQLLKIHPGGLPRWLSLHSPNTGAWVWSLVRELDSTCHNQRSCMPQLIGSTCGGFPGGSVVKNPLANAGVMGSIPGPGKTPCCRAAKPVCHNYWACASEPESHNYWAPRCHSYWSLHVLEPVLTNKRSHQNEKTTRHD